MSQDPQYNVKDTQGNIYGPAGTQMLRDWVREGRIVRGMAIAPEGSDNWVEVSVHPSLIDLFGGTASPLPVEPVPVPAPVAVPTPTAAVPVVTSVIDPVPTPTPTPTPVPTPSTAMYVPTNTPVVRAGSPGSISSQRGSAMQPAGPHINMPAVIGLGAGVIGLISTCSVCCLGACGGSVSALLAIVALVAGGLGFAQMRKAPNEFHARWMPLAAVGLGAVTLIIAVVGSIFYHLNVYYHWLK